MLIEKNRPLTRFETVLVTVQSIPTVGGILVYVFGLLFVLYAIFRHGTKTFWYLGQVLGRKEAELILVFFVLTVAALAHILKQRQKGLYGISEIIFGACSACSIAFSMVPGSSTLPQWLGLFGCGYIIARGLGNVTEWQNGKFRDTREAGPSAAPPDASGVELDSK